MGRIPESVIKQMIHQSNLIEGFDDEKMDAQGLEAWHYLVQISDLKDLTLGDIHKLQKINMQPNWRGYFRKIPVYIGGSEALQSTLIPRAMSNLLSVITFTEPRAWHVEFEKIHPFVDGNGRTGRLLMWWMQLGRGEDITKITYAKRNNYYEWFQ